jgi:hypothetical protein
MSNAWDRWEWRQSRYDDRVHAFELREQAAGFAEAACSHCVPFDKVDHDHEGSRCMACLLIVGSHLAEQHRTGVSR